ncbi:MAG: hypothetical protein E5Y02_11955 [Mesorhizobium sp.]|nr:MAG: hypothetical protein E5Y02_11955 [Mesorhizobium sp.]
MDDEIIDVSANRKACGPSTQRGSRLPAGGPASAQKLQADTTARMPLGFPPSCLYVAIADRAIGFEMPPDIPANELKK